MAYRGECMGCHKEKTLYYAKGTEFQHCWECHKKGYRKGHGVRAETLKEYFARLAAKIEAAPLPSPVPVPPPRVQEPRETSSQRAVRLSRERAAKDRELEAVRQQNKRQMEFNRAHYTPRQEYGSRTPLK